MNDNDALHWEDITWVQHSRFRDTAFTFKGRFAIGRDDETGQAYLSFPVSNRMVDYLEYYALTNDEYAAFKADIQAARAFAERARAHLEDDRLIMKPGTDRGTPS